MIIISGSTSHGPRIVTNGLVLYLDAANSRSYDGSSLWLDLSTFENHVRLLNNPTFETTSGGCLSFNGSNTYGIIDSNPSLTTLTPTLIVACTTNSGTVLAKGGYNSYWNYGLTGISSTDFKARNNIGDTTSPTFTASTNLFNIYTMAWNGSAVEFYRNGIFGGSSSSNYSPIANNSLYLNIGCAWSTITGTNVEFFSGKISFIQIYNRVLSSTEVLQNYNALKARYGL
jgi:hypothetical protein